MLLSVAAGARAQVGTHDALPVPLPERPFLLVDAPKRFAPTETAHLRVQLRDGGEVQVALFRVLDPDDALGQAGRREGVSVAQTSLGAEAEARLLPGAAARGPRLERVAVTDVAMPGPDGMDRIADETVVYDSNEDVQENVATYWVRDERFSVRDVDLGRLPAGLYLAQVRGGPWVSSALVSVGHLVLVARRGDVEDVVRATDGEGHPRPGLVVERRAGGRTLARRADAEGVARFPAVDHADARFVARRGDDVAWVDVGHARLDRCDPRVYVATGRPLYRRGETVFVRGHVRGCDRSGGYVGLASRDVTLESGAAEVRATTDADGNFVAQIGAVGELTATLDGRPHRRVVRIDDRRLPVRDVVVTPDRSWAVSGQTLTVRVADPEGGWPRETDAVLETPTGRLVARVGPGRPAVFHVPVPPVDGVQRFALRASVDHGALTLGEAEIWIGPAEEAVSLTLEAERGVSGEDLPFVATLRHLDGAPRAGRVSLEVFGTDGNVPRGRARHTVALEVDGRLEGRVPLVGEGPWMLVARRGASRNARVVWSRARPPSLSERGPLAVAPSDPHARVGDAVEVRVRAPRRGTSWLTLEQGGVVASAMPSDGAAILTVPEAVRGHATLVLTHVHAGEVTTASTALEVETSRPMSLSLTADRPTYARGDTARVALDGRSDGRPHDAVVSLWLADAGYWGLGEDGYPLPGDYLSLPGRPASGGDSTRPFAFGAEEGRALESKLDWDGRRLPRSTHRHGWGHGGDVIRRFERRGTLSEIAQALAHAARLDGASVEECDEAPHHLRVWDLPWDLVALRVADEVGAQAWIEDDRLELSCAGGAGMGAGGGGLGGRGARVPRIRTGTAGLAREQRLEGTLHFVGLARLGPDGHLDLDVPLPDHPGRWRIEALAIADDGGGARAHAVVHTRQALEAWLELPTRMSEDDVVEGALHLTGPSDARVAIIARGVGLALDGVPAEVTLVDGVARLPVRVRATSHGAARVEVSASSGPHADAIRASVTVAAGGTAHRLDRRFAIGPAATDVDVPLPELDAPASISLALPSVASEIEAELERLREARWDHAHVRLLRLEALAALRRAGGAPFLDAAIDGEVRALASLRGGGSFGYGEATDVAVVARVVAATENERPDGLEDAAVGLAVRQRAGELHGVDVAHLALAGRPNTVSAGVLARALGEVGDDPVALSRLVRAGQRHGATLVTRRAAARLEPWLRARLASPPPPCDSFWRCWLDPSGATVAQAAEALVRAERPGARALGAAAVEWLARRGESSVGGWSTERADTLALVAALEGDGRDRFEVRVDGRPVSAPGGAITVPAGAHRVTVRFAARVGRARTLSVRGDLSVRAPAAGLGDVALSREVVRSSEGLALEIGFTLARPTSGATLRVPLGAGATVDGRSLPGTVRAMEGGAVVLELSGLGPGPHRVRLPLLGQGRGDFTLAPAHLVTSAGEWGITSAGRLRLQ